MLLHTSMPSLKLFPLPHGANFRSFQTQSRVTSSLTPELSSVPEAQAQKQREQPGSARAFPGTLCLLILLFISDLRQRACCKQKLISLSSSVSSSGWAHERCSRNICWNKLQRHSNWIFEIQIKSATILNHENTWSLLTQLWALKDIVSHSLTWPNGFPQIGTTYRATRRG